MRADLIIKHARLDSGAAQILYYAALGQPVAAFDIGDRACDILIRHRDAPSAEFLDAQPLINQQAQDLIPTLRAGIARNTRGKCQQAAPAFDFATCDDITIHHGDNAINAATCGLRHGGRHGGGGHQQGRQQHQRQIWLSRQHHDAHQCLLQLAALDGRCGPIAHKALNPKSPMVLKPKRNSSMVDPG